MGGCHGVFGVQTAGEWPGLTAAGHWSAHGRHGHQTAHPVPCAESVGWNLGQGGVEFRFCHAEDQGIGQGQDGQDLQFGIARQESIRWKHGKVCHQNTWNENEGWG